MVKEIEIGGNNISFLSNGATPIFYKQIFNKDLLKEMTGDEFDVASDKVPELAFVMAKQAEKADMKMLSYDSYIDWLSQFSALDLALKGSEIAKVYIADSIPMEEPKKKKNGAVKE